MITQPLEIYGSQATFGGGLKLINRAYNGPLIKIIRFADEAVAEVYPDSLGKISLDSYIDIGANISSSVLLGEFLNQPGYDSDYDPYQLGSLTAGVLLVYDQSPNLNNLENSSPSTQPLICVNGAVKQSLYGLELFMEHLGSRYFEFNAPPKEFTLHLVYRPQELLLNKSTKILYQSNDAFQFNTESTFLILTFTDGEEQICYSGRIKNMVGGDPNSLVLIDEDYYSNYNGGAIEFENPDIAEKVITLETTIATAAYNSALKYRLGGANFSFNTCIIYEGTGNKSRRHATNLALVDDVPNLKNQLNRFSPESFYNTFYGAKAIYSTVSLAGLNTDSQVKLIDIRRSVKSSTPIVTGQGDATVYADASGLLSLSSPIEIINGNSSATTLGEFLNGPNSNNVDNLPQTLWGYVLRLYDQSLNEAHANYFSNLAIIYNGDKQRFEPYINSTDPSIVRGFNFDITGSQFQGYFSLGNNKIISPKSIFFVFANNNTNLRVQSQLGGSFFGAGYFSRLGNPYGDYGVSINGPSSSSIITDFAYDTKVHTLGISLGSTPTLQFDNETPITFSLTGISSFLEFGVLGPLYGTLLAAIVYDQDRLDEFEDIMLFLNGFFGVENTIFPETLADTTFNGENPGASYIYSTQQLVNNNGRSVRTVIPATEVEGDILNGIISKEIYDWDVKSIAQNNDANILRLYNQLSPLSNTYLQATNSIKIYNNSSSSFTRDTTTNKIVLSPDASQELFTTTKVSLTNNFCIVVVGAAPSTSCNLLGDGTCSISFDSGVFTLNTTVGSYSFITSLTAGQFFILRADRNNNNLVLQISTSTFRGDQYLYTLTTDVFEFDTVLGEDAADTTTYTGGLFSLIVYEESKQNVQSNILTSLYTSHGIVNYPPVSLSIPVVPSNPLPVIESHTTISGAMAGASEVVTMDLPSDLEVGDVLLLVYSGGKDNACSQGGAGFNFPPSAWSKPWEVIYNDGNSSSAGVTILYRVVDGTETNFSEELYARSLITGPMYYTISILRLTNVDTTDVIQVVGTGIEVSNNTTSIPSVTTTRTNSLAFAVAAYDGADFGTFEPNSPWVEYLELEHVNGEALGTSLVIATQPMESVGATGNATIVVTPEGGDSAYDGMIGVQFVINSAD